MARTDRQYLETPAKRTYYKDVLFASHTEAYWASVFETFNWKWTYEPRGQGSSKGIGVWNPDFGIERTNGGTIYVEIKPGIKQWCEPERGNKAVWEKMESPVNDIDKTRDLLLFGYRKPHLKERCPYIGWLGAWWQSSEDDPPHWAWSDARAWYEQSSGEFGLFWSQYGVEFMLDERHEPPVANEDWYDE